MKDEHLMVALRQALRRYGSAELPVDAADAAAHGSVRPRRPEPVRGRRPGWISIGEVEACQSPNSYPRLSRRAIKARCLDLAREGDGPVKEVRTLGLRTWVRVAFAEVATQPAQGDAATAGDVGSSVPPAEVLVEELQVPLLPGADDAASAAATGEAGLPTPLRRDLDDPAPEGTP